MIFTAIVTLTSLLQASGKAATPHVIPDSAAARLVTLAANPDARLLLIVVVAVGGLQLILFGAQAWLLGNGVNAIRAATSTIRDNAMTELRAYLNITVKPWPHPSTWSDGAPGHSLTITNNGRTPARDVRARFEYAVYDDTTSVRGMTIDGQKSRWGVLGTGDALDVPVFGAPVTREQLPLLELGSGHTMLVYGEVWYADSFGAERRTAFCRHINWKNGDMISVIPSYGNDLT
jgi:hypothetical protein